MPARMAEAAAGATGWLVRPAGPVPAVSVLLPAFDAEPTLAAAVASLAAQTLPDLEILIADDGSRDGTRAAALALAAADPRIGVLAQPNAGKAATLNRLIAAARGRLVAIQDADDESEPDRLAAALARLDADPTLAAVLTGHSLILGGRVAAPRAEAKDRARCRAEIAALRMPAHDPTLVCRTEVARALGFAEELRIAEGVDFVFRLGEAHALEVIGRPLYRYRIDPGSLTRRDPAARRAGLRRMFERARARRGEAPPDEAEFEARFGRAAADPTNGLHAHFTDSAWLQVMAGERAGALATALAGLRTPRGGARDAEAPRLRAGAARPRPPAPPPRRLSEDLSPRGKPGGAGDPFPAGKGAPVLPRFPRGETPPVPSFPAGKIRRDPFPRGESRPGFLCKTAPARVDSAKAGKNAARDGVAAGGGRHGTGRRQRQAEAGGGRLPGLPGGFPAAAGRAGPHGRQPQAIRGHGHGRDHPRRRRRARGSRPAPRPLAAGAGVDPHPDLLARRGQAAPPLLELGGRRADPQAQPLDLPRQARRGPDPARRHGRGGRAAALVQPRGDRRAPPALAGPRPLPHAAPPRRAARGARGGRELQGRHRQVDRRAPPRPGGGARRLPGAAGRLRTRRRRSRAPWG
jgi:hypothetical protein